MDQPPLRFQNCDPEVADNEAGFRRYWNHRGTCGKGGEDKEGGAYALDKVDALDRGTAPKGLEVEKQVQELGGMLASCSLRGPFASSHHAAAVAAAPAPLQALPTGSPFAACVNTRKS